MLAFMTQRFIVDTHCCRSPVACAILGLFVGNWWRLNCYHALYDGARDGDLSSTSCSLGPHFYLPPACALLGGVTVSIPGFSPVLIFSALIQLLFSFT